VVILIELFIVVKDVKVVFLNLFIEVLKSLEIILELEIQLSLQFNIVINLVLILLEKKVVIFKVLIFFFKKLHLLVIFQIKLLQLIFVEFFHFHEIELHILDDFLTLRIRASLFRKLFIELFLLLL